MTTQHTSSSKDALPTHLARTIVGKEIQIVVSWVGFLFRSFNAILDADAQCFFSLATLSVDMLVATPPQIGVARATSI